MSYSKRYRERTIEYRQAGHSLEATHQVFKVSKSTIQKWEKQMKETGNLEKKDLHRSFRKIDPEKLKAYVAAHPDVYQSEMVKAFGCSESGIRDALRRHKITRKKTASWIYVNTLDKKVERLCCFFEFLILLLLWCQITDRAMDPFTVIPCFYVFKDCSASFL